MCFNLAVVCQCSCTDVCSYPTIFSSEEGLGGGNLPLLMRRTAISQRDGRNFIQLMAGFIYEMQFVVFGNVSPSPGLFHMAHTDSYTHGLGSCYISIRSSADICIDAVTRYLCPQCFLCMLALWEEAKTRQMYLSK